MDGTALIFCEGALGTPQGKVANAIVRSSRRYDVLGVIDSTNASRSVGEIVEGVGKRIPVFADLNEAIQALERRPNYLVIGLSPDDDRLLPGFRRVILNALRRGISVDGALRPYLQDDPEFPGAAQMTSSRLRSVGYPVPYTQLHEYTGRVESVPTLKIAVVGTSTAAGNRTTAGMLTAALVDRGMKAEMLGTGATSWFQGVAFTVILDSILRRYIPGEIEHLILSAYEARRPDVFVMEDQGSILNLANPVGLSIMTTARPHFLVMQHAPARSRTEADPFGLVSLERHIRVCELLAGCPVAAIALSHYGLAPHEAAEASAAIHSTWNLLVVDVLTDGAGAIVDAIYGRSSTAGGTRQPH